VGAEVQLDALPRSAHLASQPGPVQRSCLLAGGDDYELLFTAPAPATAAVQQAATRAGVPVTAVGRIVAGTGLRVLDASGQAIALAELTGFDHFAP
jgi:thiamine-monophosphate kinase